jgi:hypothetical protein
MSQTPVVANIAKKLGHIVVFLSYLLRDNMMLWTIKQNNQSVGS